MWLLVLILDLDFDTCGNRTRIIAVESSKSSKLQKFTKVFTTVQHNNLTPSRNNLLVRSSTSISISCPKSSGGVGVGEGDGEADKLIDDDDDERDWSSDIVT